MSNLPALYEPPSLRVVACPHPFREEQIKLDLAPGLSLWDILLQVQSDIIRYPAHVWVDDDYIPREEWETTWPAPGSQISIRVLPQGPVGRMIAQVFIAIAAIAAAILIPPLGVTMGWWTAAQMGTWGALAGGIAGITISLLGNLALNMLFPPTRAPIRQAQLTGTGTQLGAGSIEDSPTYSLSGGSNQPNKFGPIPKILGRHKMFPLYGAETYTEIAGDQQYLRLFFVWGISRIGTPAIQIENLKIGDTPLENFTGVQIEHRNLRWKNVLTGAYVDYGNEPLTLYSKDIHEEVLSISLEQWIPQMRTTREGATYASVDITWPNGLYANEETTGNKLWLACDIVVELRRSESGQPFIRIISLDPETYQQWIDTGLGWAPGENIPSGWSAVYIISTLLGKMVGTYILTTNSIIVSLRAAAATSSAVRQNLQFLLPNNIDSFDIQVTRYSPSDTSFTSSQSYWTALRSINASNVWLSPVPCAITVLRIKASNQLSGTVDKFSGIVSGIIPDWDIDSQTWITRITQNPASHYREMLQGSHNMDPYQDSEIDLVKIRYFHEYCEEQGWKYNKIIDYDVDLEEILSEILASGRAALDWSDSRRSLIIDEPQEFSIGPAFTPRNTKDFSSQITYPEEIHCWRCSFKNELADWTDDERLILLDGYALLNSQGQKVDAWGNPAPDLPLANIYQSLPLLGITHPDLIFRHARYHGAQMAMRFEKHQFQAYLDQLVARRGDRVKFSHDVILAGLAWARVKSLVPEMINEVETGYLAGVILDAPCPMAAGQNYAVRFRLPDNSTLLRTVETVNGKTATLTFLVPIPPEFAWPGIGDLAMFGESGKEAIDLMIYAVRPDSSLGAKLTLVEYNENIYNADQGVIPPHDPQITIPPEWWTPIVGGVRSDGSVLFQEADGSWQNRILIDLAIPGGLDPNIIGIEAQYWRQGSSATPITLPMIPLGDWEISLRPVEDGITYEFRLRYVKMNGLRGPWSIIVSHTVVGKTAPPANVSGLNVAQIRQTVTVSWNAVADRDLANYEVRYGTVGCAWEDATVANGQYSGTTFTTTIIPPGTWDILLKAIDTSGNYSQTPARKTYQVRQFYTVLSDEHHWSLWNGTLTNLVRNPRTGNLNPADQAPASANNFDLFNQYVVQPYSEMSYETQEIDLGEDEVARAWARTYANLGPGESGTVNPQLYFDYRLAGGSYGGWVPWSVDYFNGRYCKFKVIITAAEGILRLTDFETIVDQDN